MIVHSHLRNAIELRVYEMVEGESVSFSQNVSGTKTARRKGDGVVIAPGRNEVDDGFWREWSEQNRGSALAAAFEEEKKKEGQP